MKKLSKMFWQKWINTDFRYTTTPVGVANLVPVSDGSNPDGPPAKNNMHTPEFDPEKLRPAEFITEPDPRNALIVRIDTVAGTSRPLTASDLHEMVSCLSLSATVPENIAQHFETVKNIFLYSWFIYRFQPVAELQSLACLEFALRERFANEIMTGAIDKKNAMLRGLLTFAVKNGVVKSEAFSGWSQASDPDRKFAKSLAITLPEIRNNWAHGSDELLPSARTIIALVAEIINQLFPAMLSTK